MGLHKAIRVMPVVHCTGYPVTEEYGQRILTSALQL
jgi:hypothetical protein